MRGPRVRTRLKDQYRFIGGCMFVQDHRRGLGLEAGEGLELWILRKKKNSDYHSLTINTFIILFHSATVEFVILGQTDLSHGGVQHSLN